MMRLKTAGGGRLQDIEQRCPTSIKIEGGVRGVKTLEECEGVCTRPLRVLDQQLNRGTVERERLQVATDERERYPCLTVGERRIDRGEIRGLRGNSSHLVRRSRPQTPSTDRGRRGRSVLTERRWHREGDDVGSAVRTRHENRYERKQIRR